MWVVMISAAVAGPLAEQWRVESRSWPSIEGAHVFLIRDRAVHAVDGGGRMVWTLAPPEGCGWLSVDADPRGVVVSGQVFADPYLHLRGVADRSTGALLWSEQVDGRERGAMTDVGVEASGFFRGGWQDASRQFFEPTTGAPITAVFDGAILHEDPIDGGGGSVGYLPAVHSIGQIGPALLLTDHVTVSAWASPAAPLWEVAARGSAHALAAGLYRLGGALVWLDPETGLIRQQLAVGDECSSAEHGAVRVIPGGGVVVQRCGGFDVLDADTGARRARVTTEDIPAFTGEAPGRIRYRTGEGEAVQWYAPDTLLPGPRVVLPVGVQVEVLGDGLLLLAGTDQGFTRRSPAGTWEKTGGYGNVEAHGAAVAWYHDGELALLDPATGAVRWEHPEAVLVGALSDGTLVVRLTGEEVVIGLR